MKNGALIKWRSSGIFFFHSFMVNRYLPIVHKILHGKPFSSHFPSVGIVHDIGRVILLQLLPDRYNSIIEGRIGDSESSFYNSELALGFEDCTHAEIGAYFLDWWNLPEVMTEVALFHHRPDDCSPEHKELLKAAYYTDRLVHHVRSQLESEAMDLAPAYVPGVADEMIQKLGYKLAQECKSHNEFFDGLI